MTMIDRRNFLKQAGAAGTGALAMSWLTSACQTLAQSGDRPNFLWITSEDNGPRLGCYGYSPARTPHLDALAAKGFTYTRAYANAPVCAPGRITVFTGRYASTLGLEGMRSWYQVEEFRNYADVFRQAGYYCTNNAKTDYNHDGFDPGYWDESSKKAHYRNRRPGQPFFHVFSDGNSHEWMSWNLDNVKTDPSTVTVPPYLPDTPLIRKQLARGVDMIENADRQIGAWIDELEKEGLMDDTIIVYYGDHGGVFPRTKRFLYQTGTRVPLIVYIPEKFKHLRPGKPGSEVDRLVSFIDFAPTALSLAGLNIPDFMQGAPFLGPEKDPEPEDVYLFKGRMGNFIDLSRGLRTRRYLYIRNYMPHRPRGSFEAFQYRQQSYREWEKLYDEGKLNKTQSRFFEPKATEELYDTQADPWEIDNLAGDPAHRERLAGMREQLSRRVRDIGDLGFITEIRSEALLNVKPLRTAVNDGDIALDRAIETAEIASWQDPKNLPELIERLDDPEPAVGYWAATGCCALKEKAAPAKAALWKALKHPSWEVRIPAAEALCYLGERDRALPVLIESVKQSARIALYGANALNYADRHQPLAGETIEAIKPLVHLKRGQVRTKPASHGFTPFYLTKDMLEHMVQRHEKN